MKKIRLTLEEQDTTIEYDNSNYGRANVMSHDRVLSRKLLQLIEDGNTDVKMVRYEEAEDCYFFEVPKKWVKVSPPRKSNMTEEQRQAVAERLRAARAAHEATEQVQKVQLTQWNQHENKGVWQRGI